MGHLGLVPRKSTWRGGLRAVGRTADEALALMQDFRDLENAGAFSVEAEVIPAEVMAAISPYKADHRVARLGPRRRRHISVPK